MCCLKKTIRNWEDTTVHANDQDLIPGTLSSPLSSAGVISEYRAKRKS